MTITRHIPSNQQKNVIFDLLMTFGFPCQILYASNITFKNGEEDPYFREYPEGGLPQGEAGEVK